MNKRIRLNKVQVEGKAYFHIIYPNEYGIKQLLKQLPDIRWFAPMKWVIIPHSKYHMQMVFRQFKGIAWVDAAKAFEGENDNSNTFDGLRNRYEREQKHLSHFDALQAVLNRLEGLRYSLNTARSYMSCLSLFFDTFKHCEPKDIERLEIEKFLLGLVREKNIAASTQNQYINAIKFYYEHIEQRDSRYYHVSRPIKPDQLPKVISKDEVSRILKVVKNVKHLALLSCIYSAGLRVSEVCKLKVSDIDSNRMIINISGGKGKKDRISLLAEFTLKVLRDYFKIYRPNDYLFPGERPDLPYSTSSVRKLLAKYAFMANIGKKVNPHMLRHSFATHLLEDGVDLRYIQTLLGHSSSKTTEIYTFVSTKNLKKMVNPLDSIGL